MHLLHAEHFPLNDRYLIATTLSPSPYYHDGFNLAKNLAKNDAEREQIAQNRQTLQSALPNHPTPMWLTQTHSDHILTPANYQPNTPADAFISHDPRQMPIVLTADCIPVLIADEAQSAWAAVHAGWQGVYQNIVGKTIRAMQLNPKRLWVYLAPSIQARNYEIDEPFYARFLQADARYQSAFRPNRAGHYWADLPAMVRLQLHDVGVPDEQIFQSALCSFEDARLFSYRRDKALSGRMASFILPR